MQLILRFEISLTRPSDPDYLSSHYSVVLGLGHAAYGPKGRYFCWDHVMCRHWPCAPESFAVFAYSSSLRHERGTWPSLSAEQMLTNASASLSNEDASWSGPSTSLILPWLKNINFRWFVLCGPHSNHRSSSFLIALLQTSIQSTFNISSPSKW